MPRQLQPSPKAADPCEEIKKGQAASLHFVIRLDLHGLRRIELNGIFIRSLGQGEELLGLRLHIPFGFSAVAPDVLLGVEGLEPVLLRKIVREVQRAYV